MMLELHREVGPRCLYRETFTNSGIIKYAIKYLVLCPLFSLKYLLLLCTAEITSCGFPRTILSKAKEHRISALFWWQVTLCEVLVN